MITEKELIIVDDCSTDGTRNILNNIKNSSQFKIPIKEKKSFNSYFSLRRLSYSLATVFILVLVVALVFSSSRIPVIASTITVDINPSIEITLDDEDNVINVTAINDEGAEIINRDIKFKGLTLDRVLEILIEEAYRRGYIIETIEENVILISVDSNNSAVKERIEAQLETKIANEVSKYAALVRVIKENGNDLSQAELKSLADFAKENKITVAKLLLINKIIILDDAYTLATLKSYSIRDLYLLHYQLLDPVEDDDIPNDTELRELENIAQTHKISVAQLVLINKIIALENTYTIDDLKDYSVRELYGIHYKLLNQTKINLPGNSDDSPGNGN